LASDLLASTSDDMIMFSKKWSFCEIELGPGWLAGV
jgi:hypothetical protein